MDVNKVSQAVKKQVEQIIKSEDGAQNITQKEYEKLGELLNGLSGKDEKEYVDAEMEKYRDGTKNNAISKAVKELVEKAKRMLSDKKVIDNEQEARALLSELKNGNLSTEDRAYLEHELQKAGFGHLLDELKQDKSVPNDKAEPPKADDTKSVGTGNNKGTVSPQDKTSPNVNAVTGVRTKTTEKGVEKGSVLNMDADAEYDAAYERWSQIKKELDQIRHKYGTYLLSDPPRYTNDDTTIKNLADLISQYRREGNMAQLKEAQDALTKFIELLQEQKELDKKLNEALS